MRCWSRSSSRTCTTSMTRWRKSTATSSRSPAPRPTWGPSGWCASTRLGARRPARCCSTSQARWSFLRRRVPPPPAAAAAVLAAPPHPRPRAAGRPSEPRRAREGAGRPPTARTPMPAGKPGCTNRPRASTPSPSRSPRRRTAAPRTPGRARAETMAYNPSLGVVAAEAGGAVRLPRRPRLRSSAQSAGVRRRRARCTREKSRPRQTCTRS